jgi:tellurium resistance protein TerD
LEEYGDFKYRDESRYDITIKIVGSGVATADPNPAAAGQTVALTAAADSSSHFTDWQGISDGISISDAKNTDASFVMPDCAVTIRATFTADNKQIIFIELVKGQRIKIDPSVKHVTAVLEAEADFTPDISAFILDGQTRPKATGEELIFYNQPAGADGAIRYDTGNNALSYDLSKIPTGIEKIAVVVSVDEPGKHFGLAKKLAVKFISDKASYIFEPDVKGTSFTAIEMCEVYRKEGIWRFNAKGVGVNGGLTELCSLYGVEVE